MIGTIAAIGIGGGLGALARYGSNAAAAQVFGSDFPWGTMMINIAGSFLMGLAAAKFMQMEGLSQEWRSFITTGFLGGFTTFSAFSLDFVTLWERGAVLYALAYMLASVIGSVLALFLALWIARGLAA
jgi:fluoride exporter